jgi:hypothetical protein
VLVVIDSYRGDAKASFVSVGRNRPAGNAINILHENVSNQTSETSTTGKPRLSRWERKPPQNKTKNPRTYEKRNF